MKSTFVFLVIFQTWQGKRRQLKVNKRVCVCVRMCSGARVDGECHSHGTIPTFSVAFFSGRKNCLL